MDYTNAALSYALLLFPLGFASVVIAQGVTKMKKKDESGKVIVGMGVVFVLLVPVIFFLLNNL